MSIKYAILGLLHYKDMHGYHIKAHIEKNFGHMWSINYGQIYPNLRRLEEEGLVTMKEVAQTGLPDRKLYSITEKGKGVFFAWLKETPSRGMLIRDSFLLKFVFFGFGDKEKTLEIVEDQIRIYESQKEKRLSNMRRWHDHDIYVRLMAELGLSQNEMMLGWLYRVRDEIRQELKRDQGKGAREEELTAD